MISAKEFNIPDSDFVVDIGGGPNPLERADMVIDPSFPGDTSNLSWWFGKEMIINANGMLVHKGKEFTFKKGSIEDIPLKDKEADFIYCGGVFQYVDHPDIACNELMRAGKRGFIKGPELSREAILSDVYRKWWMHRIEPDILLFFPKQEKDSLGKYVNYFYDLVNQNINGFRDFHFKTDLIDYWYVQLNWEKTIKYIVIYPNGKVETNV